MTHKTKHKLTAKLQEWLDDEEVTDDLGGTDGMWQDTTTSRRNANIMADAVDIVVRSMSLQNDLELEINGE